MMQIRFSESGLSSSLVDQTEKVVSVIFLFYSAASDDCIKAE